VYHQTSELHFIHAGQAVTTFHPRRQWHRIRYQHGGSKVHTESSLQDRSEIDTLQDLQGQYQNYKNGLQQIAQKIGDVEQEAEEHKWVT
jgi:hypothetical protein